MFRKYIHTKIFKSFIPHYPERMLWTFCTSFFLSLNVLTLLLFLMHMLKSEHYSFVYVLLLFLRFYFGSRWMDFIFISSLSFALGGWHNCALSSNIFLFSFCYLINSFFSILDVLILLGPCTLIPETTNNWYSCFMNTMS